MWLTEYKNNCYNVNNKNGIVSVEYHTKRLFKVKFNKIKIEMG